MPNPKCDVILLEAGSAFGELALLEDSLRNATVVVKSDMVELLVVMRELFDDFIREPLLSQKQVR